MNTIAKKALLLALSAALLGGCAPPGHPDAPGPRQTGGALLGGLAGGLAGSAIGSGSGNIAAIAAGTLFGALIGSEVGRSMDEQDRRYMLQAQAGAYAAPVGSQIQWSNPATGNYGYYMPTREGRDATGLYCREFQQTIIIHGRQEAGYGTACQQPDGSWRIVQ